MKNKQFLFAALIAIIAMTTTLNSCKPEDHSHDGQETITTLKVKLTSLSGTQTFVYKNINGTVTKDSIKLQQQGVYTAELVLLNETKSPVEDITAEIKEKADEHQFFFTQNFSSLSIDSLDKDKNGKDVGIISTWKTWHPQTGTLKITLKHLGEDPKTGNIDNGETDMDVVFDVVVQ